MDVRERIETWLASGLKESEVGAEVVRRHHVLSVGIVIATASMWLSGALVGAMGGGLVTLILALGGVLLLLQKRYLQQSGDLEAAGYRALGVGSLTVLASQLFLGGVFTTSFSAVVLLPIAAGLVLDAKALWRFTGLILLGTLAFFVIEQRGALPADVVPESLRKFQMIAMRLFVLITSVAFVQMFMVERERAEAIMVEAREQARVDARAKAKLADRVEADSADVRAMLSSLEQGLCTITEGLEIGPRYAEHLEQMLGTRDIAGRSLDDLLLAHARIGDDRRHAIRSALDAALAGGMLAYEMNAHHFPRELEVVLDGREVHLELDWQPMEGALGDIDRIMVTMRDVTAWHGLRAEADAGRARIDILGDLIGCDAGTYSDTMSAARVDVARCGDMLSGVVDDAVVAKVFRAVHSLKGDARGAGWRGVADAAHRAEQTLAIWRDAVEPEDRPRLDGVLDPVVEALESYRDVWRVTLARSERAVGGRDGTVPLAALAERPLQGLAASAARQGKTLPTLVIEDGDQRVVARAGEPMRRILSHLVANALDHGVDSDASREARGATVPATIRLTVEGDEPKTLRVSDDGLGLDLEAWRRRDASRSDAEWLERIFDDGATRLDQATESSGRGVGLAAARELARGLGGDLTCVFVGDDDAGAPQRAVSFLVSLPSEAWVQGRRS